MKKRKAARSLAEPWVISQDEPPYFDLDLYHDYQFIQNEIVDACWRDTDPQKTRYTLSRLPVPGTLTATIYNDSVAIQILIGNKDGSINLKRVVNSVAFVRGGMICHTTGEIILEWDGVPGKSDHIVTSYEYGLANNRLRGGSSL